MTFKFNMSMMGQMSFFLGLQISQSPKGIFINQSNYALERIKKYGMLSTDSVNTPMVNKSKLDKDLQGKPVDHTHYRRMIGSLMYLTSSRPDLVFSGGMYARYQAKTTKKHLHAVKRIFRYLKGSIDMGLWYLKDFRNTLTAYMQMQTTPGVKILDKAHLKVNNSWEINLLAGRVKRKRALLSLVQRRNIFLYLGVVLKSYG
ncbi:uncharacterized mitochondrial protein-like protein [Tanacetum coccineum]